MSRLIDAYETYKVLIDYYHIRTPLQQLALKEALARVPTVDAEPVIRCKDCEYSNGALKYCSNDHWVNKDETSFCSSGEKKDE